ncbi:MAG: GNAT family N-acetyltransferase [Marinilabiliaceae bacterium]|nr:GNAT family N-acetyltransferase [Marinilabiliaceae bacterium]
MKKNSDKIEILLLSESEWIADLHDFKYSICHHPDWIKAVLDGKNAAIFLNFVKNEKVVGKISGIECCYGSLKGKQLYFYASPALREYEQNLYDACHVALYKFAKKARCSRIYISSWDQQHELICTAPRYFTADNNQFIVNLESDLKFRRLFKRNVKRAEINGAQFSQNNSDEVFNKLFELLDKTRERRMSKFGEGYRHNTLHYRYVTKEALKKMVENGLAKMYVVTIENEIHTVLYNLEENNRICALLIGADEKAYQLGLSSFITSNVLILAKEKGFSYYNPLGTTEDEPGKQLGQFKISMGAEKSYIYGATTNFIGFPQKLLNPLLNIGRKITSKNPFVTILKKIIN